MAQYRSHGRTVLSHIWNPASLSLLVSLYPLSAVHRNLSFFSSTVHFIMSRYPDVRLYFFPCSIRSFLFSSQTRASTGTTTTDTHPIQRRVHTTSKTTAKILSHTPKITSHVLLQRDTHRMVKNSDRVIHPWDKILTQRHTGNLPHRITTKHTPRPLILLTCCPHLPRHRFPISSSTLVTRLARLTVLSTSTSLPHLL